MVFGSVFRAETLPIEATEVSVISGEAFAALLEAQNAPSSVTEVAQPAPPVVEEQTVEVPEPEVAPQQEQPEVVEQPPVDEAPDVTEVEPLPEAEISDEPPVLPTPEPEAVVLAPISSERPVPRPSDRVAPEPVVQPEPEALPDPVEQDAVELAETGESVQEPQEATAPEEAASEIVTEAEQPSAAPDASLRPPARRPTRPAVQTAQAEEPAEAPAAAAEPVAQAEPADTADAVADALAEALGQASETPNAPAGPPLSAGEKDALRVAVQSCWNVGSLSSLALETTVIVAVSLAQDGKPVTSSIRQIGSEGGTAASVKQAFETARRAVIRCGARGFELPSDKYEQWKDIEMTFNPERMRIK
jgi:hypothetical protein